VPLVAFEKLLLHETASGSCCCSTLQPTSADNLVLNIGGERLLVTFCATRRVFSLLRTRVFVARRVGAAPVSGS
jgi:hypothetical protein